MNSDSKGSRHVLTKVKKSDQHYHSQRSPFTKIRFTLIVTLGLLLILFTAVRIGSAQPTVQTLSATNITDTSAQLNGDLSTNGQDTEWAFKVFDSSGIQIQTVCSGASNAGSVGWVDSVNCPVYGLQSSTKYGFALIARWSGASGASGDWQLGTMLFFTTTGPTLIMPSLTFTILTPKSAQPGATTLPATGITATSATLNGKVVTNGQDTVWLFGYYQGNSFLGWCPAPPGNVVNGANGEMSVNCPINGLSPSSTYDYFLQVGWKGKPASQPSVNGEYVSFTTLGASSGPTALGFDFGLSVSPSTVSVVQGGTAHYTASVMYNDPSYAGTMINIQLTGLGPGMDYHLLTSGDLTVTTSPMTPTGSYSIILTGSANGVTHQTGLILVVTSAQPATTPITTVAPPTTPPPTATSAPTTSTVAVTSVITQTATIQPSSKSTQGSTSDIMSLLQQNSLLIIGTLAVALAALFLHGRRRRPGPATQIQPQTANVTYCPQCGTQNSLTNSYCRKCGTKLLNTP